MNEFILPIKGGCQCGYIRYKIGAQPATLYICHCTDCQKQSSSAFGMSLWVECDSFSLVEGELSVWETQGESGATKQCAFCNQCGSRIYHRVGESGDRYLSLKAGSLDDCSALQPIAQIWTRSAQPWGASLDDRLSSFSKEPEDEDTFLHLWHERRT